MNSSEQKVSLEGFLVAYTTAKENLKEPALKAALLVLAGCPPQNRVPDLYLTARQVAERYSLNETTVWRWQFPSVSWGGVKRYKATDCDAYLVSSELKGRRAELAAERAVRKRKKQTSISPSGNFASDTLREEGSASLSSPGSRAVMQSTPHKTAE